MAEASSSQPSEPVHHDVAREMEAPASVEVDSHPVARNVDDSPQETSGEIEDDSGNSGSTKSLSEHAIQIIVENGRRYCNDTYCMPNDEPEQTRLSILHQLYLLLSDGELTRAPLAPTPSRVLDVGAGPGDWAIAMGEEYPETQVIATDISLFDSQPVSIAPPNVFFQIDDAEGTWTYNEPFDFIHARGLSRAITNWPHFYRQAFEHLKPGGSIEVSDADLATNSLRIPNPPPNSYFSIYISAVRSAADVAGYIPEFEHLRPSALAAAGFVNIQTFDIEVPVGTWPTDVRSSTLGKMALIVLLEGLEATSMRLLTKYTGWDPEDVIDLCEKVKMEIVTGEGITAVLKIAVATKPE